LPASIQVIIYQTMNVHNTCVLDEAHFKLQLYLSSHTIYDCWVRLNPLNFVVKWQDSRYLRLLSHMTLTHLCLHNNFICFMNIGMTLD